MKSIAISVLLGISVAGLSATSLAGDHREGVHDREDADSVLQRIVHMAGAGQPGHGWQYFSDMRQHRAVVISPEGVYYASHGEGLKRVYRATAGAQRG